MTSLVKQASITADTELKILPSETLQVLPAWKLNEFPKTKVGRKYLNYQNNHTCAIECINHSIIQDLFEI